MEVYIDKRRVRIDPKQSIGKGGEADVYDIGGGHALKVFKAPNHPDYVNIADPAERARETRGAQERIATHQKKLPAFPKGLPPRVVTPVELARDAADLIVGYTMPYLSGMTQLHWYADKRFRLAGVPTEQVFAVFRDLRATVEATHKARVTIGDFNDLNVLTDGTVAYCIDADSFQFAPFLTKTFTARFVDPLCCDEKATSLMLVRPHSADSDWYAFAVMFLQSLLFVDPYGGLYVPKDPKNRIPHDARPLHRITIFHPEVRYPRPAVPFGVLPDELLEFFHQTFERDVREPFPQHLLEFRWTKCTSCGMEHARPTCPSCAAAAPIAVKSVTVVRGKVTATRIFQTRGLIVHAAVEGGDLRWLVHDGGEFRRENGSAVLVGGLDPHMRYEIHGSTTLLGRHGVMVALASGTAPEQRVVDSCLHVPMFRANASHVYWLEQGRLMRDGTLGPERVGDVLAGQTRFWVGDQFGVGFYHAGGIQVAFTFDAESRGINDSVRLPSIPGQLIDAAATFAGDRCWWFMAFAAGGRTMHRAVLLRANGTVEATADAVAGDGSWLGRSTIHGAGAAGAFLLVPTDDGVVRVEVQSGQMIATRSFPDTEPFVDSASTLVVGRAGLYVVGRQEIQLLKIA